MNEQLYREVVSFLTTRQFPVRIRGKDPTLKLAQSAFRRRSKKYELCDEKLYFRKGSSKLTVVQASERDQLFQEFHDSPSGGHGGLNLTFKKISQRYYWLGLMSYLKIKVKQCQVCQNRELWPHMKVSVKEQSQRKRKTPVKQKKINSSVTIMGSCKRVEALNSHLSASTDGGAIALENVETAAGKPNSPLTTHVLDTARGAPATNLRIEVFYSTAGQWNRISEGETNSDGRCPGLLTIEQFIPGIYKIYFDTGSYFKSNNIKGFYPLVEIVFEIEDVNQHYHVPLLLSPFSYSTYRGS